MAGARQGGSFRNGGIGSGNHSADMLDRQPGPS
jgi:hypothetical protein